MTELLTWMFFAYLFGSLSSAVIVCKSLGLDDPREFGSNNPGATNVLRMGHKKAAALVLFGDAFKGFAVVLFAQFFSYFAPFHILLVGLAVFIGHLYPIFFDFKGGKGVATYCGVLAAFDCFHGGTFISAALTWFIVIKWLNISAVAAIISAVLTPVYAALWSQYDVSVYTVLSVMSLLLIWRHRQNMANILKKPNHSQHQGEK